MQSLGVFEMVFCALSNGEFSFHVRPPQAEISFPLVFSHEVYMGNVNVPVRPLIFVKKI